MSLATDQFNLAVGAMRTALEGFLPPVPPTPASTLALVSAAERPVGVGNWQGNVERGPLAVLGVRGGRVEAVVRFELRTASPADSAAAVLGLQASLRAARDTLAAGGFLVIEPRDSGSPEFLGAGEGWRQAVEYAVLYEYRYEDPEEAGSLLVQIPVALRGEHDEDDLVTRALTRWDREGAPPLAIRGPRPIGELTLLAFSGGGAPAGEVVIRRTFDGAPGPGAPHFTVASFRAALLGGSRNARLVLPNVQELLDAFDPAGDDVTLARLGDLPTPPPGGVPAAFTPRRLNALADAPLQGRTERLEISYQFAGGFPGGSSAVVYLRAGRGPAA